MKIRRLGRLQESSRSQLNPNLAQLGPILDPLGAPRPCKNLGFLYVFTTSTLCVLRRSRWPQDGSKSAPRGPKTAPGGPKRPPRAPKRAPRRPQDGPKTAPSRFQDAFKNDFMLTSLQDPRKSPRDPPRTSPGPPPTPPRGRQEPQLGQHFFGPNRFLAKHRSDYNGFR